MAVAIGVMVVAAGASIVIFENSQQNASSLKQRKAESAGAAPMQAAMDKYLLALQSGLTSEGRNFDLTGARLAQAAGAPSEDSSAAIVAPPSEFLTAIGVAVPGTEAVRQMSSSGTPFHWQILKVDMPVYPAAAASPSANLTVYLRGWMGTRTEAGDARIIKAQFRPTYFSDYQLITDEAIRFENGATVNGHVHTNGFLDGTNNSPTANTEARVWASGSLSCSGSAFVTTARGLVDGSIPGSCARGSRNRRNVSMLRAEDAVDLIQADCSAGVAKVACL